MRKNKKINLILAQRHQMLIDGIAPLIDNQDDMKLAGTCNDSETLFEMVKSKKPDIVLLDLNVPEEDSISMFSKIKNKYKDLKVIALSGQTHKHIIAQTLRAGASGFIVKESGLEDLLEAIRAVSDDQVYICPRSKEILVDTYVSEFSAEAEGQGKNLTDREYEVIRQLSEGCSSKEIAVNLNVSSKTIDACRRDIMHKLKFNSQAELIKYAIRTGIASF